MNGTLRRIKESCHGKEKKMPYKIWISEIILQQTRVLQGLAYYNKFIEEFPTLETSCNSTRRGSFQGMGRFRLLFTVQKLTFYCKLYSADTLMDNFHRTYDRHFKL